MEIETSLSVIEGQDFFSLAQVLDGVNVVFRCDKSLKVHLTREIRVQPD